jgi:hypothetical protein
VASTDAYHLAVIVATGLLVSGAVVNAVGLRTGAVGLRTGAPGRKGEAAGNSDAGRE